MQNAPTGSGGNAVGTVLVAISSLIGGVFGLITILILSFYLLIEADAMFEYLDALRAREPRAPTSSTAARAGVDEGERVAARAVHPGRRDGDVRGGRPRR